jgi:hypothetical protein
MSDPVDSSSRFTALVSQHSSLKGPQLSLMTADPIAEPIDAQQGACRPVAE